MTLRTLASAICKREKKKVSVSIGNVREVLRIICDMEHEALDTFNSEISPVCAIDEHVHAKRNKRKGAKGRGE